MRKENRCRCLWLGVWTVSSLASSMVATPSVAQGVVSGRVIAEVSGERLAATHVQLIYDDGSVAATTVGNEQAEFRFVVDEIGSYSLSVQRIGYAPLLVHEIQVDEGDELELEVRLGVNAVPMDPVSVLARGSREPLRLRRFRERANRGETLGRRTYLLREDIARLRPPTAQHLLGPTPWNAQCQPTLLLDGLQLSKPLTAIRVDDLAGVELYKNATDIPPEYYRSDMCGLAVFWTRSDAPQARPLSWKRIGIVAALVGITVLLVR